MNKKYPTVYDFAYVGIHVHSQCDDQKPISSPIIRTMFNSFYHDLFRMHVFSYQHGFFLSFQLGLIMVYLALEMSSFHLNQRNAIYSTTGMAHRFYFFFSVCSCAFAFSRIQILFSFCLVDMVWQHRLINLRHIINHNL